MGSWSNSSTSWPARARAQADERPMTPPPTTRTRMWAGDIFSRRARRAIQPSARRAVLTNEGGRSGRRKEDRVMKRTVLVLGLAVAAGAVAASADEGDQGG